MANIADFSQRADALPDQDFQPIPEGKYTAEISGADLKTTKDGTGQYINLKFSVLGPAHAGRIVFSIVNIQNKNQQAEEIGLRQLKELRAACGIAALRDTDELLGKTVKIKVKIQKSEQYGDKNTVAGFESVSGGTMPTGASTTSQPAASGSTPPWARK